MHIEYSNIILLLLITTIIIVMFLIDYFYFYICFGCGTRIVVYHFIVVNYLDSFTSSRSSI